MRSSCEKLTRKARERGFIVANHIGSLPRCKEWYVLIRERNYGSKIGTNTDEPEGQLFLLLRLLGEK